MTLPDPAREVLRMAEHQLVALANQASASRDYEGATQLLEAARRVKHMADGEVAPSNGNARMFDSTEGTSTPSPQKSESQISQSGSSIRRDTYPKFLRDGDNLVKVGWSKSEKSEYEHKCPRMVLSLLGQALVNVGAKGRRFSMDKVLPISDPADGTRLPDYQCYLSLAWLRFNELVIQHGRQGYSLPKKGDLMQSIETLWDKLPNRS